MVVAAEWVWVGGKKVGLFGWIIWKREGEVEPAYICIEPNQRRAEPGRILWLGRPSLPKTLLGSNIKPKVGDGSSWLVQGERRVGWGRWE